jgi:hypothetical protein
VLIKIGTLGKMAGEFAKIEKEGGFLVASLKVKEGVQWEVVTAVSHAETWQIIKSAFKPSIIWFLLTGWAGKKNDKLLKL